MNILTLKIIVPLLVLTLQVIMKFVVNRRIEGKTSLDLICELPTNIIFLSISFALVYIFLIEPIKVDSVIVFVAFIIAALIVVTLFRECKHLSDAKRTKMNIGLLVLLIFFNYLISLGCLYSASEQLLEEKTTVNKEHIQEIKK